MAQVNTLSRHSLEGGLTLRNEILMCWGLTLKIILKRKNLSAERGMAMTLSSPCPGGEETDRVINNT